MRRIMRTIHAVIIHEDNGEDAMKACIQKFALAVAVYFLCAALFAGIAAASDDCAPAAQSALRYTVAMTVENRDGSGFIIKSGKDYYVVAASAVIGSSKKATVEAFDGKKYETELRGSCPGVGLAVLKVLNVKGDMPAAPLADSKAMGVGVKVIAVGRVKGYGFCVTAGIVGGIFKATGVEGGGIDCVQTDAAINVGESGGPLVGLDGKVVGMCCAPGGAGEVPNPQFGPSGSIQSSRRAGLSLALPLSAIGESINAVISVGGTLATATDFGFDGLDDVDADTVKALKLSGKFGAKIIGVVKGGPADRAGLAPGDVITEFNGKPVKSADDLKSLARSTPLGSDASVKYTGLRDGKPAAGKADIKLRRVNAGDIRNNAPAAGEAVVSAVGAAGEKGAPGAAGMPAVFLPGGGGDYTNVISRVSQSVILVDNGATAVLLPRSVAGNDKARYLVTVQHLILDRPKAKVTFYEGKGESRRAVEVEGEVVGTDSGNDIAVIRVAGGGADGLALGGGEAEYGREAVAVWTGQGFDTGASAGIVSAKQCQAGADLADNFCATSAHVVDGAALVDASGRFLGLCTKVYQESAAENLSYFIPAKIVVDTAKQLITGGKPQSGYLGLDDARDLSLEERIHHNIPGGSAIVKIAPGGPAARAGLKAGQIIVNFGKAVVISTDQLRSLAAAAVPGRKVQITVIDTDGSRKTVEVEVARKKTTTP